MQHRRNGWFNRLMNGAFRILASSWFIALVLGAVTYVLIGFKKNPYKIDLEHLKPCYYNFDEWGRYFDDLAGENQFCEFDQNINRAEPGSSLIVFWPNGIVKDQWNFRGKFMAGLYKMCTGDYDHDGFKEVYSITRDSNDLIINVVEPFGDDHIVRDRLIDTIFNLCTVFIDWFFCQLSKRGELQQRVTPDWIC